MTAGASVLIVDDDPGFSEPAKLVLEAHGYNVRVAADASQAICCLRERRPQLLLLDLMVPEDYEGTVVQVVDTDPTLKSIPILLVSAITPTDYVTLFQATAAPCIAGFLSKPIEPSQLVAEVQRILVEARSVDR